MRKISLVILLISSVFNTFGQRQNADELKLNTDLSTLKTFPFKVLIERTDLGGYETTKDTCKVTGKLFKYIRPLSEPEFLKISFYWMGGKITSTSFWALPRTYRLNIGNDFKPVVMNPGESDFLNDINDLEQQKIKYTTLSADLVKQVSYENKKIEEVENGISYLRDSIDDEIDENIYRKFIIHHLNSSSGLYALCKYAERPFKNPRVKSEPEKIRILLNSLDADLRGLPSAIILSDQLDLSNRMAVGKRLPNSALSDTAGRIFKIVDLKSKYTLVEFWASWCVPCRAQSPELLKVYAKYKNAGFQIISISTDQRSSKEAWLQAIRQDHIGLWPQLSDFDHIVRKVYGIRFIPADYLIDPEGVIIARDLRGSALEETLEKIFKY